MRPQEVVVAARPVPGIPIFAFGTAGRTVTVRSQQRRAIHLVDALLDEGVIGAGGYLAVVGAGAAGLTAAVRAAHAGCRVLLLERSDETLATFRGNTSRLLHPNLYAWPRPEWSNPDAELPILSWSAGTAASVASTLDRAFKAEVSRTGLIDCRTMAKLAWSWPPVMRGSLLVMQWTEGDERLLRTAAVSAVILAVGFGREPRTAPSSPFPGYWDNDLLSSVHGAKACMIFGAGDGGMTDALRVRIRDFDQGSTFSALLQSAEAPGLAREIEEIETLPDARMDAAYRALSTAWLDTAIRDHGLRPTHVTLADSRFAFGPGRFPLNKLLVSRLWRMRELRVVQRRLDIPGRGSDGRFGPVELEPGVPESFDLLLIRFGQGNAIGELGDEIADGCRRMVEHSTDPATMDVPAQPPNGTSTAALAAALSRSVRLDDAVETVLLYLRHAAAPADALAAATEFDPLRDEIAGLLGPFQYTAIGHAANALDVARAWLISPRAVNEGVIVRALAEALDFLYGHRLRRSLRGPAHQHTTTVVAPNRLMPRGVAPGDRRGRFDGGLGRLALNAGGDCEVVIEWTQRSWHLPPRIAVGHACDGLESLTLDRVARQPRRFFGARATDPARHAHALGTIAARCRDQPLDFIVLGEFILHADPAWADATHRATGAHVIAGIGHERDDAAQRHHRIAVFAPAARRLTSKFAASSYERALERWTEDIHPGPRRATIAISGDDQQSALIGGEDLGHLDLQVLKRLRPDLLLVAGGELGPEIVNLAAALTVEGARYVLVGIAAPHQASSHVQVTVLT